MKLHEYCHTITVSTPTTSGGSKKFERGGWKTTHQPRRHLSQMHTKKYVPVAREKVDFRKKFRANKGGRFHCPPPPESATAYDACPEMSVIGGIQQQVVTEPS